MGNAESSSGASAAAPARKKKAAGTKAAGTKAAKGSAAAVGEDKRVLIVEKVFDGVSMKELQGIVGELRTLKAALEAKSDLGGEGDDDEDDSKLSFRQKIVKSLKHTVDEDAPVGEKTKKKLPFPVVATYWTLGKAVTLVLIAYFTYSSFVTDQAAKNLSLDNTTTQTSSSSNFRLCLSVPNAVTGAWRMDSNGFWEGALKYTAGLSVYLFQFEGFKKSNEEYQTFMQGIKSDLAVLANTSKSNPIWLNLVTATSWVDLITDGSYQHKVSLAGDPAYVFNRFYKSATITSSSYNCYAIPDIFFDRFTGGFTIQYLYGTQTTCSMTSTTTRACSCTPGSGYIGGSGSYSYTPAGTPRTASLTCATYALATGASGTAATITSTGCCPIADTTAGSDTTSQCVIIPGDAGYLPQYDSAHFTLKYNIRTLTTAFAINQGILPLAALTTIKADVEQSFRGCYSLYGESDCESAINSKNKTCGKSYVGLAYNSTTYKCSIKVQGTRYNIRAYMDPSYPGMEPVYCLVDSSVDDTADATALVCLVRMGSAYVYPFINHLGASSAAADSYNWGYGCYCSKPKFPSSYSMFYDSSMYSGYDTSKKLYPGQYGSDYFSYCNKFDLMHGFVMFKGKHYDAHFYLNAVMANLYSAEELNNMAYFAGFVGLRLGGNAGAQSLTATKVGAKAKADLSTKMITGQTNAYSFCGFATGVSDDMGSTTAMCSVYAMQTVDSLDQRVSQEGVNDNQMSCSDFVSLPDASWDDGNGGGTVNNPPTTLVQDYYECYNTIFTSIIAAFGAAAGLAGSIAPLFLTAFVALTASRFITNPTPKPKTAEGAQVEGKGSSKGDGLGSGSEGRGQGQGQAVVKTVAETEPRDFVFDSAPAAPLSTRPGLVSKLFGRRGGKAAAKLAGDASGPQQVSIEMSGLGAQDEEVEVEVEEEVEEEVTAAEEGKEEGGGGGGGLPPDWEELVDDDSGDLYYYNSRTEETSWDKPTA